MPIWISRMSLLPHDPDFAARILYFKYKNRRFPYGNGGLLLQTYFSQDPYSESLRPDQVQLSGLFSLKLVLSY